MKKKLIIFIAAALVLCLMVGGTYAYFTTSVKTHNVITSGNVKVKLVELDENGDEFKNLEGVMPGQQLAKVVMAENTGNGAAWIRMQLSKSVEAAEGVDTELDASRVSLDINSDDWTEKDGWYYYNLPLMPGLKTEPIISTVSLDGDMDNDWQSAKIIVDVYMQATQVANNGTSALTAAPESWPIKK